MKVLDEISEQLSDSMPEVSDFAVEEAEEQERKNQADIENPPSDTNGNPTDKNGNTYNPETHEISPLTGKAIKKRKGGVKKSVVNPTNSAKVSPAQAAQAQNQAEARATGKFAAALLVTTCMGVFGDEFKPEKSKERDEFAFLENAFADYFEATGRKDLPPGMVLTVAIGSYVGPRFTMPKTQSRIGAIKDWCVGKYFSWRGKKILKDTDKKGDEK